MKFVYELTYADQREPQSYGLFSTEKKALAYLQDYLHVDISEYKYEQYVDVDVYGKWRIQKLRVD